MNPHNESFLIGELSLLTALYQVVLRALEMLRGELNALDAQHRESVAKRDQLWTAISEIRKTLQATPADDPSRVKHDLANVLMVCELVLEVRP